MDSLTQKVVNEIVVERERALSVIPENFDVNNSKNDWIAYINAYIGRAADKVFRNEREGQEFRDNMVKAGGLIISAIIAYDKGYC